MEYLPGTVTMEELEFQLPSKVETARECRFHT